jgi:hypothetical protein
VSRLYFSGALTIFLFSLATPTYATLCAKCTDNTGSTVWTAMPPAGSYSFQAATTACQGASTTYANDYYEAANPAACGIPCSNIQSDATCPVASFGSSRCNSGYVVDGVDACYEAYPFNCQWHYIGSCCLITGNDTCAMATPTAASCPAGSPCNRVQSWFAYVPPEEQEEAVTELSTVLLAIFFLGLLTGGVILFIRSRQRSPK